MTPEQREKYNANRRLRYANDPVVRARRLAANNRAYKRYRRRLFETLPGAARQLVEDVWRSSNVKMSWTCSLASEVF